MQNNYFHFQQKKQISLTPSHQDSFFQYLYGIDPKLFMKKPFFIYSVMKVAKIEKSRLASSAKRDFVYGLTAMRLFFY